MALGPGTRLGPYEVTAQIGVGGMGEVYRAIDTNLKRQVAIKALPAAMASDPDRLARFQREAEVLASLNHSNIAAIYGLEETDGTKALVMELVEGPTLADRIAQGAIPLDEALPIAKQIAEALEAAHEQGIIHRDLKPANIKLRPDGMVKVLDFGLAKLGESGRAGAAAGDGMATYSPTLSLAATQVGVILGTAAYMSPEQARGKPVDKRADIWAFGCVLYEMLSGSRLFAGEDLSEVLAKVIRDEPDLSRIPFEVRHLLRRCLERDPKKRLRDISVAMELVEDAPNAIVTPSHSRPRYVWMAAAGASVLVLAGLAVVQFRETPTAAPTVMRFEIAVPRGITLNRGGVLSPDGTRFMFPAVSPNGRQIWVRTVDSLDAHPIPGTLGTVGTRPFWSPDGQFIVFEAEGKLKKVDTAGGPVQTLCDLPGNLLGGAWTRDGTLILGSNVGPILRVPSGGGVPIPVTKTASGEAAHQFPFLLPDERSFVYHAGGGGGNVYIGSLDRNPDEQSRKAITTSDAVAIYAPSPSDPMHGYLLTIKEGVLLAQPFDVGRLQLDGDPVAVAEQVGQFNTDAFVSVSNRGSLLYRQGTSRAERLAWFDRQGTLLSSSDVTFSVRSFALSPDASRVVLGQRNPNHISIFDFARGIDTRITFGNDSWPVWSPDGTRVAYASYPRIYQIASSGAGNPEPLFESSFGGTLTDWSSDGRYLLYHGTNGPTGSDLFVVPLDGDRRPAVFGQMKASEAWGRFSPDARWIAYLSNESQRLEVYVRPFNGMPAAENNPSLQEGKWQISKDGAASSLPAWRRDGKELYYISTDRFLTAVDVSSSPTFQPGTPRRLFAVPAGVTRFDVAPDGRRFLLPVPADTGDETSFTIVLNWQAALDK